MPPPATAITPTVEPAPTAIPPAVDSLPAAPIDNVGGQPAARNVPIIEVKLEDIENYIAEKAKRESLEVIQELESKKMQALTQKISKMKELMRGHGMGYSFDFDDMIQFEGDKFPDKFKMPQLQKFDSIRDPRIHLSQYITTMSTIKAPLSIVTKIFLLSLEGMAIN